MKRGLLYGLGALAAIGGARNPESFNQAAGVLSGAMARRRQEEAARAQYAQQMALKRDMFSREMGLKEREFAYGQKKDARGDLLRGVSELGTIGNSAGFGYGTGLLSGVLSGAAADAGIAGFQMPAAPTGLLSLGEDRAQRMGMDRGKEVIDASLNLYGKTGQPSFLNGANEGMSMVLGKPSTMMHYEPDETTGVKFFPGSEMAGNVAKQEGQEWDNRLSGLKYQVESDPKVLAAQKAEQSMFANPAYANAMRRYPVDRNAYLMTQAAVNKAQLPWLQLRPRMEQRKMTLEEWQARTNAANEAARASETARANKAREANQGRALDIRERGGGAAPKPNSARLAETAYAYGLDPRIDRVRAEQIASWALRNGLLKPEMGYFVAPGDEQEALLRKYLKSKMLTAPQPAAPTDEDEGWYDLP